MNIYFATECDVNMIFLCWGKVGEEDPTPWPPLYANLWPHQKRNRIENGIRNTHSKLVYKSVKKITKTTTILNETEPIFFEILNALI